MKTFPLLLLMLVVLSGCTSKDDDFISKYCPGSCTVFKGNIATANGTVPLAGIKLNVYWRSYQEYLQFGYSERRKAVATTDQDGRYDLRFLLREEELNARGQIENCSFRVVPALDETKYFICFDEKAIFSSYDMQRDTTFTLDYTLPQTGFVDIQLQNRQAMQSGDKIIINVSVKSGENNNYTCSTAYSFSASYAYPSPLITAALQPVLLTINKMKNGVYTETQDTITVAPGERLPYQLTF
ncbi:hypothetical protein MKJ04_20975 [Pontibacter sp. E15-1]|uniref:hypothetical protein n=1 Tax=Pontibacter sp. E15-1 TaxID=2919918 RepID=UPI001F4F7616|nr:hypothetical protein [Pontibacter sp. E15-1]MCJ8167327.1 hypothetical protein [Pontibacter sp. E15-1]